MGVLHPHLPGEAAESTNSLKPHQSPHSKENSQKPPHKDEESSKPGNRTSGTSSPWVPHSISTSKTSHKSKLSPPSPLKNKGINTTRRSIHLGQKSGKTNATVRTTTSPPNPRSHSTVKKTGGALTRAVAAPPVKGATNATLPHVLLHSNAARKRPALTVQTTPQAKAHGLGTRKPTRSMSDYNDHLYFVTPRNASTPHKSVHQLHNHSSSMRSRCLHTPLDCSLYNNFTTEAMQVLVG